MLTCLLNPKAYLFMFAVFPQFLRPEAGGIWLQATILGTIIAATQFSVYVVWPSPPGAAVARSPPIPGPRRLSAVAWAHC